MSADDELAKKIALYQGLAKDNPKVDVGMLMVNALQSQKQNTVSPKSKRWAYLISIGLPPFGLLFALKYFAFSDQDDASSVAWTCIILTIISVLMLFAIGKLFFSSTGTSIKQIEQIKPADIYQLGQ